MVEWPRPIHSSMRAIAVFVLMVLVAAACGGGATTEVGDLIDTDADTSTVRATIVPTTPVAETPPVELPTAVPEPTSFAIPTPTPLFGPTGRPSFAQETRALTATDDISGTPLVYDAPDGKEIQVTYTRLDGELYLFSHFTNPTSFDNPLAVLVLEGSEGDEWARVQIPTRPIMTGWIKTEGWEWSTSDYYVRINVGNNSVTVWNGDEIIAQTDVVTGDTGRETPIVSTYVDEIMPGFSASYGPWMMSLGTFSNAINTFGANNGLPKVAMHGTNRPDLIGQYASNGCIRVPNDIIAMLAAEVPVGTRVDIVHEA